MQFAGRAVPRCMSLAKNRTGPRSGTPRVALAKQIAPVCPADPSASRYTRGSAHNAKSSGLPGGGASEYGLFIGDPGKRGSRRAVTPGSCFPLPYDGPPSPSLLAFRSTATGSEAHRTRHALTYLSTLARHSRNQKTNHSSFNAQPKAPADRFVRQSHGSARMDLN